MTVTAASSAVSGTLVASAARVLGVHYRAGATAGTVVLKDGGSSGTARLTIYTPASAGAAGFVPLAGGGLVFTVDVYAALSQADGVTVVYAT